MTPLQRYQKDLQRPDFIEDSAQALAVKETQRLFEELAQIPSGWKAWFKKPSKVKGLYFYGGVGRGKTYLIDNFYACLPFVEKERLHFHRFMRLVHEHLKVLRTERDPLPRLAKEFAKKFRVLCLDEFHVTDITDAMILSGLLHSMFAENITLVTTSNEKPDELYRNGLQRERFLSAIELIKENTLVLQVDGGVDYRLRVLEKASVYYAPMNGENQQHFNELFHRLAIENVYFNLVLEINGRNIPTIAKSEGILWLDFQVLCNIPRAVADYIELAQSFHTVFLSNIPILSEMHDDFARRLINLVDEFYDRNVKLIILAADYPEKLYTGDAAHFKRTISRLQEMSTHAYLERPHLP
ncbi:MAG: cell division protein ZapE [Pseudomonadota bacterium]|jgi:cell division protein ZapE